MKLGLYLRVSTELQETRGFSLQEQEGAGIKYAAAHGLDYHIYKDAESGGIITRKEFQRLIKDIEAGDISAVWVKALDRIARSSTIAGQFRQLLRDYTIPLIEGETTLNLDNPIESLNYGLRQEFAEYERLLIKSRMGAGRDKKFFSGGLHVKRLYGHKLSYGKKGESVYSIDPEEAEVVKEIFSRVIAGDTYRGIALDLNRRGIPAPLSKQWRSGAIQRLVTQKLYIGLYDYKDIKDIISENYKPIIDAKIFFEAQDIAARAITRKRSGSGDYSHHLCTGIIKCYYCNRLMFFKREKHFNRKVEINKVLLEKKAELNRIKGE
jgi:site-specific DNA recombinase